MKKTKKEVENKENHKILRFFVIEKWKKEFQQLRKLRILSKQTTKQKERLRDLSKMLTIG